MCNGGLRAVPKLTATHVEPNNFQRMNVRLAVQVRLNPMFIFVLQNLKIVNGGKTVTKLC